MGTARTDDDGRLGPRGLVPGGSVRANVTARDEVEALQQQLPQQEAELLEAAVDPVDRQFIKMTVPEPSWYLELGKRPELDVPDADDAGWWWRRRPEPLPW